MDLDFDPIRQTWSLRFNGKYYTWKGEPFDRPAAEAMAMRIIFA